MSVGWTWAFGTPFSCTKMFGGTKQGVAISWPRGIKDKGGIRNQFHHVIDVVPTVLEAAGLKHPDRVEGIPQAPIEGVSMAYTFDRKNAAAPSTHKTQYFEMLGDHAIYHDGWIASSKVMRVPWDNSGKGHHDPASWPWELYDLSKDWTQFEDVAAKYPEKQKEMEALFWKEAERNQVLPLNATTFTRIIEPRPSLSAGRSVFTYSGEMTGTPNGDAPSILAASYNFKADIEIPKGGAEGVIVTQGGRFGGYGFYLLQGKPVFNWNMVGLKHIKWKGKKALSPGKQILEFYFKYHGLGRSGTGVLKVDGKVVVTQKMEKTIPMTLQWYENFDVGADTGTPVDDKDYQVPCRFGGKLDKLTLTIDRPMLSKEDIKNLEMALHANSASE